MPFVGIQVNGCLGQGSPHRYRACGKGSFQPRTSDETKLNFEDRLELQESGRSSSVFGRDTEEPVLVDCDCFSVWSLVSVAEPQLKSSDDSEAQGE